MTSNAGAREMVSSSIGFGGDATIDPATKGKKAVDEFFSPEFRNRLDDIITFRSLNMKIMEKVIPNQLILFYERQTKRILKIFKVNLNLLKICLLGENMP